MSSSEYVALSGGPSVKHAFHWHDEIAKNTDIPSISPTTKKIFKELHLTTPDIVDFPLKTKVATLNQSIKDLKDAKAHPIRDKIFGLLRAALFVGVVAAMVFAAMASGPIGAALILVLLMPLFVMALTGYYIARLQKEGVPLLFVLDENPENLPDHLKNNPDGRAVVDMSRCFLYLITAPALTIYEGFGKISRLEKQVAKQQQEVQQQLEKVIEFFKNDPNALTVKLREKIGKFEEGQKVLGQSGITAGKREIEAEKKEYEKALEELDKAVEYYGKLQLKAISAK